MRATSLAFTLASFLLSCQRVVSEPRQTSGAESTGIAGSAVTSNSSVTAGGGGSGGVASTGVGGSVTVFGASTGGYATTASSSATSAGGAEGESPPCIYSVTGAVNVTDAGGESAVVVNEDGSVTIECGTIVLHVGLFHGPGSYTAIGSDDYRWVQCDSSGCTSLENFYTPFDQGRCAIVLTAAPGNLWAEQIVAGTFSCTNVPDELDPTKTVAFTGGFTAEISFAPG